MARSPPVSRRSWPRYSTPALTLSVAEFSLSGPEERLPLIQVQVPGRICITPRALASETMELSKPLSCHATAAASEPGTPWSAAIWAIVAELTTSEVG